MSNYCPEPYRTVHYDNSGTPGPCCTFRGDRNKDLNNITDYLNSDWLANLKTQLENGERPAGCNNCWKKEDRGEVSMRQNKIKLYGKITEPDLHDVFISFGNICNKQCVVCRPGRSHLLAREFKQAQDSEYVKQVSHNNFNPGEFMLRWDTFVDAAEQAQCLFLDGGEPLITQQCNKLLDHLIENGLTDKDIFTTTNGTVDQAILDKIKQFRSVHFNVSIEAVSDRYRAVRYPHDWQWFTDNLELIKRNDIDYSFACVINAFNVTQLPEITEYFINNKYKGTSIGFELTTINNQPFLGIDQTPKEIRHGVADQLQALLPQCTTREADNLKNAIKHLTNEYAENTLNKRMLAEYATTFGELRNINYKELIPWIKL